MAMILVSGYLCLQSAVATQKLVEPRAEIIQNARVAIAAMTADLRAACPLSKDFDMLGMPRTLGGTEADNLDFATHNYTPRHPNEGDFCEVSYYLDPNPESGRYDILVRRRNPRIAVNPLAGGSREELARGLLGLRFEYYDGLDWYDTWGDVEGQGKAQNSLRLRSNLSGMPEAVRITLWFDSNPRPRTPGSMRTTEHTNVEPPLVFQTVARLNLAASSRRSASAGSAGSESQDNSAQPGFSPPNAGGSQ
jgi:hypothetical protein